MQFNAVTVTLLVTSLVLSSNALNCPQDGDIAPCKCNATTGNVQCYEWFGVITPDLLTKVMSSLRQVNNVNQGQWLEVRNFHVAKNPLTQIDLSPYLGSRFDLLSFSFSTDLASFGLPGIGGGLNIETETLQVISNNLNDNTARDLLSSPVFAQGILKELFIGGNKLQGVQGDEFIPGLGNFKLLQRFDLSYNREDVRLTSGQFRRNEGLRHLDFTSSRIKEVGNNAFLVDSRPDLQNEKLVIDLTSNKLTDSAFNGNWYPNSRPATLILEQNEFDFLSEANFKEFLLGNNAKANEIEAKFNKFWCDDRMRWIKNARNELENRVKNVNCVNDPGKNVFTSNLV